MPRVPMSDIDRTLANCLADKEKVGISDNAEVEMTPRKGARRMEDVTPEILQLLADGTTQSVNLMEWLAADMSSLLNVVARDVTHDPLRAELQTASAQIVGKGITQRLNIIGDAIARVVFDLNHADFVRLADHKSDLVRQWACYAVNSKLRNVALGVRLAETRIFAADTNMSVRETAWMAFRPHLIEDLHRGLNSLGVLARDSDPNIRRFAVEVSRPRSVWGMHIPWLKRDPSLASEILESTRSDKARYVQLAVGNWLNDASKTRPDWVRALCVRWGIPDDVNTNYIIRRGLRTLTRHEKGRDGQLSLE